jgi:RNA-binding protein
MPNNSLSLTNDYKRKLRGIGHKLEPVVTVKELSISVVKELNRALSDHELIKVRLIVGDRLSKQKLVETLCIELNCQLVQQTGHIVLVLRPATKVKPKLSNLERFKFFLQ